MNALPEYFASAVELHFQHMDADSLDEVMAIERDVFPFSWTRKLFESAIREGYDCWIARDADDVMLGYFVMLKMVDEVHLLTIAVQRNVQGRGIGRRLVERVIERARDMQMDSLLLEVRPSNLRALEIYRRYGFAEIGRRKKYYEAANDTREDAIVMRLSL